MKCILDRVADQCNLATVYRLLLNEILYIFNTWKRTWLKLAANIYLEKSKNPSITALKNRKIKMTSRDFFLEKAWAYRKIAEMVLTLEKKSNNSLPATSKFSVAPYTLRRFLVVAS